MSKFFTELKKSDSKYAITEKQARIEFGVPAKVLSSGAALDYYEGRDDYDSSSDDDWMDNDHYVSGYGS